jgi:hypothetical protein
MAGWVLGYLILNQVPILVLHAIRADTNVPWLMSPVEWVGVGWFPKFIFGLCLGLSTGSAVDSATKSASKDGAEPGVAADRRPVVANSEPR